MHISFRQLASFFPAFQRSRTPDPGVEIAALHRQARKSPAEAPGQKPQTPPSPPSSNPAPPSNDTATAQPVPIESQPSEYALDDLAALYVRQYQAGSGVTLSDAAFQQKKAEVASFYSGLRDGQARLDAIVFANDGPG